MDHPIPFAAKVRATALIANGACRGINLSYFDQDGAPVANSFVTVGDLEAHARDLLAMTVAARAVDKDTLHGDAPRLRSVLMPDLVVGAPQPAATIIHESLPCAPFAKGGVSRLARLIDAVAEHPRVSPDDSGRRFRAVAFGPQPGAEA